MSMRFENHRSLEFQMLLVLVFYPCGLSGKWLEQEGYFLLFRRREDEIIRGFMFCPRGSRTGKWHRVGEKGMGFYCSFWVALEGSLMSLNIGLLSVRWEWWFLAYCTLFGLNKWCVCVMPGTWYIPFLLQDTLCCTVVHADGADLVLAWLLTARPVSTQTVREAFCFLHLATRVFPHFSNILDLHSFMCPWTELLSSLYNSD